MLNYIKELIIGMYNIWDYILFEWSPHTIPRFMRIGNHDKWWLNLLVILFWLGIYLGIAWLYFKIVGWPVWRVIWHMHHYNFRVLPWWHFILYLYIIIYSSTSFGFFFIKIRGFDITLFVAMLPIVIDYLVKVKWRIIYFPLLQVMVLAFWVGALFIFFPVIIFMLVLILFKGSLEGVFGAEKYTCSICGREYGTAGICYFCQGEVY